MCTIWSQDSVFPWGGNGTVTQSGDKGAVRGPVVLSHHTDSSYMV